MTERTWKWTLLLTLFLICGGEGLDFAQTIRLVSRGSAGEAPNGSSFGPSLSADGRFLAFSSLAGNLVEGDSNLAPDIFVFDRVEDTIERVSVDSQGNQAMGDQFLSLPSISEDGRFVAFESSAANLVAGDNNGFRDIFVRDRQNQTTTRVSLSSNGGQANGDSANPAISGDGRFVAFQSRASNLIAGDANGMTPDVFVYDRQTAMLELVSVSTQGTQGDRASTLPTISSDGRFVAFSGSSTNLAADAAGFIDDVFVRDRMLGITTLASVSTGGQPGNGNSFASSISANGQRVCFASLAGNLVNGDSNGGVDYFVRDLEASQTRRVNLDSQGMQTSAIPQGFAIRISGDGNHVAFESPAANLVEGDGNHFKDIFLHDLDTGETRRVSLAFDQDEGNGPSEMPSLSGDGRFVGFVSSAGNLVEEPTGSTENIFLVDLESVPDPANLIFPHFANGEILVSEPSGAGVAVPNRIRLILLNNSSQRDRGEIDFRDASGDPLAVPLVGNFTTRVNYDLAPWSSLDLETDGSGDLISGTIEVVSQRGADSQIEGLESFQILGNFVTVSPADLRSTGQIYASIDDSENTGVALYNPDPEQSIAISATLLNAGGGVVSKVGLSLGPKEQLVVYVDDELLFGGIPELESDFRGTLNLLSPEDQPFAALGLLQKRDNGALIALPVAERAFQQ